jgi:uncharacterized protein with PhoU and TrkA domain
LILEESVVTDGSSAVDSTIGQVQELSARVMILAVRRKDDTLIPKPKERISLQAWDTLVAMGTREQLTALEDVLNEGSI